MTTRFTAVIWDMDGTLVDSTSVVPDAFIATVKQLGGPPCSRQVVVDSYALGPPQRMLPTLLERDCTTQDLTIYHSYLDQYAQRIQPYPGVKETLDMLSNTVSLAVFTGASHRAATILLSQAGLDGYFDTIIGGDEVTNVKPAPDGILAACARISSDPAQAVYVGDSPNDMLAARNCGAFAAAASWGHLYDRSIAADTTLRAPADLLDLGVAR